MNTVAPNHQADSEHPWIGLASFKESDREFFAGRGEEIEQLLRLVRRDTLALLYSTSGLGKTSLLQAGLFPALRAKDFLPIIIRLDYLEGAAPLSTQVTDAIIAAAAAAKVDAPQPRQGETLWEYFHREDNHFWGPHTDLITPLLAFDQFEEFFTLGRETADRGRRATEFMSELADLVENRPPAALRDDPARAKKFNFNPARLRVLLIMREDYLGDLDYLRPLFRAIGQNRLRLLQMGERQAREVIALGTPLLTPGVEDRIVKTVAGTRPNGGRAEITVAPALLSLVLQELNERRLKRGSQAKITPDLLDVEQDRILQDFYRRALKGFPNSVRIFVEDELVTASGHRNSCALDDALTKPGVTQSVLNELVNRRLLAYEDRHQTRRVELTHDVLIPTIKASREAAQRRRQRLTAALAGALAITLLATILGGYYVFFRDHTEYYRYFAKSDGFPVGIMRIYESQACELPVSFRLTHRGINWKWKPWWKPHWKLPLGWKRPFRVEAVNALLKLTTNHSIFPYLWKGEFETEGAQDTRLGERGERLGLRAVCQWEFVSTKEGEIIYERALDRDGRMVYGLIYSPPESGLPSTRLARCVGPNGFPQFQRESGAEYMRIHYDKGWEDRITYRDGKNHAAAGPYGAFGLSIQRNDQGQITCAMSLDAKGDPTIDNRGISGMLSKYENGYDVEETMVGPDMKPRPLNDGYVVKKKQYDDRGNVTQMTLYGLNDQPVLSKKYGYHGLKVEYDKLGNPTVVTILDKNDKPMPIADGYARVKSNYDPRGNETRVTFYGVNGEPVVSKKDGYHGFRAEYDEQGNRTVVTFLDKNDKPMSLADGYATVTSDYDQHGKVTQTRFYGVNSEAVISKKDHYHGLKTEYDEQGNKSVETYINTDGKPMSLADGYATVRQVYESGYVTQMRFYSVNNKPVVSKKEGYHGLEAAYDEQGNPIIMTFLGLDGKPMSLDDGFATVKSAYDSRGNVTQITFYGVNGEPVVSKKDRCHGWEAAYDDQGNQTVMTFLGPTSLADGYATKKSAYDSGGKVTEQRFYGVNGEPVLSKRDGYHGFKAEYDAQGNQTLLAYLGKDGKPMLVADGYATVKFSNDSHGRVTQKRFYGVNGEPVLSKADRYHGLEIEYDEQGNPIVMTVFGKDGKPMSLDGYATVKSAYDSRGKVTQRRFYGVNGEPVFSQEDGYHGFLAEYDEQGNKIAETYLGKDGKPMSLADGYATVKSAYDSRGNVTQKRFYGVNGEAVVSKKDRYHGFNAQYDEQGNRTVTYVGKDGKPIVLPQTLTTNKTSAEH
jgi:hypothetical protein